MVLGQEIIYTFSMFISKNNNYQGKKVINQINRIFFHTNYVTIDHIINKVCCPEKMFDFDNLQLVCWHCNQAKSEDNAYELPLSIYPA
ncbi:hypothetical protein NIES3804_18240 [Microcystis aeruginosa NIES-3804]|uniref:HNH domain-containing protein n=2 Tax=Microcystis aeruginosa TaxID=1126 RepID=A0A6H9GHQ0_MICAE|nr:hypothetical protein NIES3804_18240 [Microcystis aeruginosa NIES-3804]